MNNIFLTAFNSMNYFFLREVFNKQICNKINSNEMEVKNIVDNMFNVVLSELDVFLTEISKEDLTEEMIEIIATELDEGDYMSNHSFNEVEIMFKESINKILGYDNDKLFNEYINIARNVYQKN